MTSFLEFFVFVFVFLFSFLFLFNARCIMQMNTLKEIRASYDELSSGYKKLLQASEQFDRESARPEQSPSKEEHLRAATPPPESFHYEPKGGLICEEDTAPYISPQRPVSSRSSGSRGGSRGGSRPAQMSAYLASET